EDAGPDGDPSAHARGEEPKQAGDDLTRETTHEDGSHFSLGIPDLHCVLLLVRTIGRPSWGRLDILAQVTAKKGPYAPGGQVLPREVTLFDRKSGLGAMSYERKKRCPGRERFPPCERASRYQLARARSATLYGNTSGEKSKRKLTTW